MNYYRGGGVGVLVPLIAVCLTIIKIVYFVFVYRISKCSFCNYYYLCIIFIIKSKTMKQTRL